MNNPRVEVLSFDRGQQSSRGSETSLYISHVSENVLLRFINRLAASLSYRTLSYLCFFLSCWRKSEKINFWQGLKSVEVKTREC